MQGFYTWLKKMFWIRYHGQNEPVEPTLVRFEVPHVLTLMTTEGFREETLSSGEYTWIEVENPYGLIGNWYLVVGTNLGAAKDCWVDFESIGLVRRVI